MLEPTHFNDQVIAVTQDVHSSIFSSLKFLDVISALRESGAILLDSGDFFTGSIEYDLFHGELEAEVIDHCYHAVAPGNHALGKYYELAGRSRGTPVLSTNLAGWPGPSSLVIERVNLLILAVMGIQAWNSAEEHESLPISYTDPVESIINEINTYDIEALNIVILSHQGFIDDIDMVMRLQDQGIFPSVVFSGHCHSYWRVACRGTSLIMKGIEYGRGVCLYRPRDSAFRILETGKDFRELLMGRSLSNSVAMETFGRWREEFDNTRMQKIAVNEMEDRYYSRGEVVDRIIREALSKHQGIAILNRAFVCKGIDVSAGSVSIRDFMSALPYDDHMVLMVPNRKTLQLSSKELAISLVSGLRERFSEELIFEAKGERMVIFTTDYLATRICSLYPNLLTVLSTGIPIRDLLLQPLEESSCATYWK